MTVRITASEPSSVTLYSAVTRTSFSGYTWLVLDDGALVELADPALRTPHAGPCLVPRANSVFYGISAATDGLVVATPDQLSLGLCMVEIQALTHGWFSPSTG